jgi:hypothetical protein
MNMIWRTFIKNEISNWKHTKWSQGINGVEIEKAEKIKSLKRISVYSNILFNTNGYNYYYTK